ncbi:MAG: TetR/AcrR family transcriptional regulator [Methanotrichaceae archaeon]
MAQRTPDKDNGSHDHRSQPDERRRCQRARQAVLTALADLLTEQPLSAISIEAIAKRAGVGKQTIYRWYPDRASLFIDLYDSDVASNICIPDMGSLEKELNELSLRIWHLWRETARGKAFRHLIASAQSNAQSLNQLQNIFMPKQRKFLEQLLDRAIARGEIERFNYDVFIDLLVGFYWYHLLTNTLDNESTIPVMISMLLNGIRNLNHI